MLTRVATVACAIGAVLTFFGLDNIVLALALAVGAVISFVIGMGAKANDLGDRRLAIISGVLTAFGSELRATRKISLDADFTSHHPSASARHLWLTITLPLADGTTARIELATQLKRKTTQKRKYTKIKDKLVEQPTVRLVPPKGKAFPAGMKTHRPALPGVTIVKALVKPRAAVFSFRTAVTQRLRGRGGWSSSGLDNLLGAPQVVAALIHSYKAVASAQRGTAAEVAK